MIALLQLAHWPSRLTLAPAVRRSLLALALVLGVLPAGCNIVGPAYILITGPPKTEAVFKLDKSRTHVVVIDDMRSRLPKRALRTRVSQKAEADLIREGVLSAERMIPGSAAYAVMREETAVNRISIVDIGRRIGADVVVYVIVDRWELSRDQVSAWPRVDARVKILDVESNSRIWPGDEAGFPLTVEPLDLRTGDMPDSLGGRSDLEEALAEHFGISIAQLFYKHIRRDAAKD